MKNSFLRVAAVAVPLCSLNAIAADYKVPRLSDGTPDLQGVWTNTSATPLERSPALGTRRTYTADEVAKIEGTARARVDDDAKPTDPSLKIAASALPPVGNYNQFWTDRGMSVADIYGEKRTSLIIDPPNGRIPPMTETAIKRTGRDPARRDARPPRDNGTLGEAFTGPSGFPTGGAAKPAPPGGGESDENGPPRGADGPEQRSLGERCIIGFGSTSGPPMLPTMYNSYYQIIQTPEYIIINVEMVHDTRIIRMKGKHSPNTVKRWMGDSIGHWDGDTLVVETSNFRPEQSFRGTSENAVITERFTRSSKDQIVYRFTIDDPTSFTAKWTGELPMSAVDGNIYEYACHEGNYGLPAILSGARYEEEQAAKKGAK